VMKSGMVDADAATIKETEKVLNDMAGYIRTELAQSMSTRIVPKPRFHYDVSVERGHKLSNLINKAMKEDNARDHNQDSKNEDDA